MFVPPQYPTHLTSQMENVEFVNARLRAARSSDPEELAWYIGLTGNQTHIENFEISRKKVAAMVAAGWINHGCYCRMEDYLLLRPELSLRIEKNPTRFASVGFFLDGADRNFLLEAPN